MSQEFKVVVEVSNRHIHLSHELIEKLFGDGYEFNNIKKLSQGDDSATEETVELVGPKGSIQDVRIISPEREKTQIEISISDAYKLGVNPPINLSGDLDNSVGIRIVGLLDEVALESGLIVAKRHLHLSGDDANKYGLKTGDIVKMKVEGARGLVFDNIVVRTSDKFTTRVHLDIEEANAANISQGDEAIILID